MTRQPPESPTWHIGAVAKRTQLSIRTIRHYDEVGLVTPGGRTDGGFRLYTEPDVDRLLLIKRMKPLGFTLDEMAALLAIVDAHRTEPGQESASALARHVALATDRRDELARQLASADEFIDQLQRIRHGEPERPPAQGGEAVPGLLDG